MDFEFCMSTDEETWKQNQEHLYMRNEETGFCFGKMGRGRIVQVKVKNSY